jgi:hypothetical protein
MQSPQNEAWAQIERVIAHCRLVPNSDGSDGGFYFESIFGWPVDNEVRANNVKEQLVQQYIRQHPEQFGLTDLAGPFHAGPDIRGRMGDAVVGIEVEVLCKQLHLARAP